MSAQLPVNAELADVRAVPAPPRAWRRLFANKALVVGGGLLLAIVVACLFNSMLLDHTEGLFYAWLTGVLFGGLESKA